MRRMASFLILLGLTAFLGCDERIETPAPAPLRVGVPRLLVSDDDVEVPATELASGLATVEVSLTNAGLADLTISETHSSCGCTATTLERSTIAPGVTAALRVQVRGGDNVAGEATVSLVSNDPAQPRKQIRFFWEPQKPIAWVPSAIDLGQVVCGDEVPFEAELVSHRQGIDVKSLLVADAIDASLTGSDTVVVIDSIELPRVRGRVFVGETKGAGESSLTAIATNGKTAYGTIRFEAIPAIAATPPAFALFGEDATQQEQTATFAALDGAEVAIKTVDVVPPDAIRVSEVSEPSLSPTVKFDAAAPASGEIVSSTLSVVCESRGRTYTLKIPVVATGTK